MATPHDDDQITVRVGTKEIYDAIIMVRADLTRVVDSVSGIGDTLKDHEERIRTSERRISRIMYGMPVTIVCAALGTVVTALLK